MDAGGPQSTTVYVIGECPVKGCKNRRRNALPGRVRSDRLRTWTTWGIPVEGEPCPASPYLGWDWAVSATLAHAFRFGDPRGLDPAGSFPGPSAAEIRLWTSIVAKAEAMYALGWVCDDHDRFMRLTAVDGVIKTDHGCDGRCEAATRASCVCSCGGRNHGAAYDLR